MKEDKEQLVRIGLKIRELREKNQFSQQELADNSEVAKSTIQRLEKGNLNFSYLVLLRILRTLNMDIVQFFKNI